MEHTELVLRAAPQAAATARAVVREQLRAWGLEHLQDPVLLLTSELVTNVVLHTTDLPALSVTRTAHGVRVSVADGSSKAPARRHASTAATTGRGVHLLDTLSDDWGWHWRPEGGKAVWFTVSGQTSGVPVPRRQAPSGAAPA